MMTKKDKTKALKHQEQGSSRKNDEYWWLTFATLVILSGVTRFYKVSEPDHVCWDETHFGKMGSWYINRTFFFDVHPPLGKMLIGLSGYLTGYDGTFPFDKPGDKYNDVEYIGMRAFCTFLGACLVPFAFLIIWEMTKSIEASTISSLLILCDVGIVTLTRYILLDPLLLFFMMASILCMTKFNSNFENPFTFRWWFSLISTGVTMSCCISIKFVGLFTIILIGFNTIHELWEISNDLSKPFTYTIKHFLARTLGLIVIPFMVYVAFFYIHLKVLHKSGNGDGFYSSAFQSKLEGNSLFNASMPRDVAYGAIVTLKNHRTGAGYLHSHWHLYPEGAGAKQQQITTYTHKDENNQWRIKPKHRELSDNDTVELVKHGDLIRLEHVQTKRNLHSHRERAPVTKKHNQVTGYGENGIGDSNDVWRVVISGGGKTDDVIKTVTTKVNLIHFMQRCVLTTTGKQLPKWAFEQQEVTCNPNLRDANGVWNIEDNINPKLPNVSFELYAASFWERFIESHLVMFRGNSGLKPKEGEVTSRPWQWPINYKGQFFSGNEYKIYLLGNPVIWWGNLILLFVYVLIFTWNAIRAKRGYNLNLDIESVRLLNCCGWLFIGWLLHYVPFYAMGRVLYFHHYFPALLFNSMLSGVVLSYVLRNTKYVCGKSVENVIHHVVLGTIYSIVAYTFYLFCPLSYGLPATPATENNSTMFGLRWMDSWEF